MVKSLSELAYEAHPRIAKQSELSGILGRAEEGIKHLGYQEALDVSLENGHRILDHSIGVGRLATELALKYNPDDTQTAGLALVGGIVHDWGKPFLESLPPGKGKYSEHDSVHLEAVLRLQGLPDLAQSIRHNPNLVSWDIATGAATVAQLAVAKADLYTNGVGEYVDALDRARDVASRKDIPTQPYFQFVDMASQSGFLSEAGDGSVLQKYAFIERCDGAYPINQDPATHGKLSSLHVAKNMTDLGVNSTVYASGDGERFSIGDVDIQPVQSHEDLLQKLDEESVNFVTGWTSLFHTMDRQGIPSALIMRSLLESSLTKVRRRIISQAGKKAILVSNASAELLGLEGQATVCGNGYDPDVFYYKEQPITDNIIFAGAPIYEKGIDHLLNLAQQVPQANFLIAGSPAMYGRDTRLGEIPQNVQMLGEISQQTIAEMYRTSAAAVFLTDPTRIFETFGKSAMEAGICGAPLVYIKNGGLATTVLANELNRGFNSFDLDAMSRALQDLVDRRHDLAQQRATLAHATKAHHPEWREVAAKLMAIGNDIIVN